MDKCEDIKQLSKINIKADHTCTQEKDIKMEFQNFPRNMKDMRNLKMEDVMGTLRNVNLEDVADAMKKLNTDKLNAENIDQFKNAMVKYVNPIMKTPRIIGSKLFELSKPALKEVGLFMLTCLGPWLFLLLCYLSTALV